MAKEIFRAAFAAQSDLEPHTDSIHRVSFEPFEIGAHAPDLSGLCRVYRARCLLSCRTCHQTFQSDYVNAPAKLVGSFIFS